MKHKIEKKKQRVIITYFSFQNEKGALLFSVIFLLSVLMIAGAVLLQGSLNERIIAGSYGRKIRAQYIAEAGAEVAMTLLDEQPDYFLYASLENPVYLKRGDEEEYFTLEWLEPGAPDGDEEYYTLISNGYCHTVDEKQSQAVLRAFVELIFEHDNGNDESENGGDAENGEDADEGSSDINGNGVDDNCHGEDNGENFNNGEKPAEDIAVGVKIINWSGW